MSIFSQSKYIKPLEISSLPESHVMHRVKRSIDALSLRPDQFMLVGSAALTAYGADLGEGRPGDVDLLVQASTLLEMDETNPPLTPSGLAVSIKHSSDVELNKQNILSVDMPPGYLPVDLLSGFRLEKIKNHHSSLQDRIAKADGRFQRHLKNHSHSLPGGGGIRVAALPLIERYIKPELHYGSERFSSDFAAIQALKRAPRVRKSKI